MKSIPLCLMLAGLFFLTACVKDKTVAADDGGYPANIAPIMVGKCATAGCHNTQSKSGAAGIDLSTWQNAMQGGNGGATIIPFYHKQSTTFLFTNTDSTLGSSVVPTMPYNGTPLSRTEVITLRDWIDNGAPNKDGFVKFSDNADRHKLFITNQGCDIVAVVDAESKLVMRYVPVGIDPLNAEGPHMVRVSADGSFWCVCFIAGSVIQQYSTVDNHLMGQVSIGQGNWNTFVLTKDGKKAFVVDWSSAGNIAAVDLVNYTATCTASGFAYPHGSALSPDEKYLYATGNLGNFLYKIDTSSFCTDFQQISVDGNAPVTANTRNIHDMIYSPDHSKYFLSCQNSNEVRVMNAANDSLIAVLPVGTYPQEFAISASMPYLFVTCMEDVTTYPGNRGSVYVIDYNNLSVVKSLNTGWQPHGIAVDDVNHLVYVANRNATAGGPAPHHTTDYGGRNGYLTLINLHTLNLVPDYKTELSADPYSVSFR